MFGGHANATLGLTHNAVCSAAWRENLSVVGAVCIGCTAFNGSEGELPEAEPDRAGNEAHDDAAKGAGAAVVGSPAGRQSDKEGQCVAGQREHGQQRKPRPKMARAGPRIGSTLLHLHGRVRAYSRREWLSGEEIR